MKAATALLMMPRPHKLLTEPVTQLRRVPMHILTEVNANSAAASRYLDTKFVAVRLLPLQVCILRCGMRSASQTLRLLACFASDSASSNRHARIVHPSKTSCIDYLASNLMPAFWTSL